MNIPRKTEQIPFRRHKVFGLLLFLNRIKSMRLPAISMVVVLTFLNSVCAAEINLIHRYNFESDAAIDSIGKFDGQLTRDFGLTEKPGFADLAPEGCHRRQ